MAVVFTRLRNDDAADVNILALKILRESVCIQLLRWHTVVPDEWIGKDENLPTVARIRETFWIPDHPSREDDFTSPTCVILSGVEGGTEGFPLEYCAILEDELRLHWRYGKGNWPLLQAPPHTS